MKYISVVIFVVLLSWTWCMATAERPLSLENRKRVEIGVEADVRKFIQKRFPNVKEVFCQQLFTEDVPSADESGLEMIAHFRCQAVDDKESDDATEQLFEGYLRIYSTDEFKTWGEAGGEINAKEINFLNGFKITPDRSESK